MRLWFVTLVWHWWLDIGCWTLGSDRGRDSDSLMVVCDSGGISVEDGVIVPVWPPLGCRWCCRYSGQPFQLSGVRGRDKAVVAWPVQRYRLESLLL